MERIKSWWRNEVRDIIMPTAIAIALAMLPIVLISSVFVIEYREKEAIRERIREQHVQLCNTYKYEIKQYHGKNGHNVFYTNSYTVDGSGIRFVNENGKEIFVAGNYIVIPTR